MTNNQKGFAHILALLLLVVGLGASVYLVGQQTNFFPRAASGPISSPTPSPISSPISFVCTPCVADVNQDRVVNIYDLSKIGGCVGVSPGSNSRCPAALDVNQDGVINQADLDCVRDVFDQRCVPNPSPTPTATASAVVGGPFSVILSNNQTSMICQKGDANCYYKTNLIATNKINKTLYKITMYTSNSKYNPTVVKYFGFDGDWTTGQSQNNKVVQPGQGAVSTFLTATPPNQIGDWPATFYIDAQTCNLATNPPDCVFYGATKIDVKIKVVESLPTPTPVSCSACGANIRGDGKVSITDMMIVSRCIIMGSTGSVGKYACKTADVNGDGKINASDLNCVREQFGKQCLNPGY